MTRDETAALRAKLLDMRRIAQGELDKGETLMMTSPALALTLIRDALAHVYSAKSFELRERQ